MATPRPVVPVGAYTLPRRCEIALRSHQARLAAEPSPEDFVFATRAETELDAHNVRRIFRKIVEAAGLNPDEWTPREMRHSFVSLLSHPGMSVEPIARLVGHSGTAVTEAVYRQELRPVLERGATEMDEIFLITDVG